MLPTSITVLPLTMWTWVASQPLPTRGCRGHGVGGEGVDDDVVAGAAVDDVVPRSADQDVVAGTAVQHVVAGAADEDVVAVAAVQRELDRVGRHAGGVDRRRRRRGR